MHQAESSVPMKYVHAIALGGLRQLASIEQFHLFFPKLE
jgi:hypothetical protein